MVLRTVPNQGVKPCVVEFSAAIIAGQILFEIWKNDANALKIAFSGVRRLGQA